MSFKQLRKTRVEKTKNLLNNIKDKTDKTSKDIKEYVESFLQQDIINWDLVIEDLTSFIYKSLKETYLLTLNGLYEIYDISHPDKDKKVKDISREIIDNLTYQGDNKTVQQRIEEHCEDYQVMDITSDTRITYDMLKILDTETISVMNSTIKNETKSEFEYAAVEETACCDICLDHMDEGVVLENDFEAPPYHPNCECIAVYFSAEEVENN